MLIFLWTLCCRPPAEAHPPDQGVLAGVCEASAVVWDGARWLIGDNEVSDHLFAFDAAMSPLGTVPLDPPVQDIEGMAVDGGRVMVVGSGGRKKSGELAPARRRAVELGKGEISLDWDRCPACAQDLAPPQGGLNVEGAAWWNGALWLGLRSPVPQGKTRIWNPLRGEVQEMDWGGYGVRDLAVRGSELYFILGPSTTESLPYRLATRTGGPGATLPEGAEGLGVAPDGSLLVVTDGGWEKDMLSCKHPSLWEKLSP